MKIVVLDGYCLNPGDLSWDKWSELGEVTIYDRTSKEQLLERAEAAEVLITNKTVITAADMDVLPSLLYIGVLATGYNVVDIEAARKRNIAVTNIPAYSTMSVAQMVFAHILNITQHVAEYAQWNREGAWSRCSDFSYMRTPLLELAGKKIGIIGLLPNIHEVVDVRLVADLIYQDPVSVINPIAEFLKNEKKCDLVLCLSHLGYEMDTEIASYLSNVDLIVGGHSHTDLKEIKTVAGRDGKEVQIVQNWKWGLAAANLKITF